MAKNAMLDIDLWKEQVGEIYKERKGKFRVGIKNFLQENPDNTASIEDIIEHIQKDKGLAELYNEIFDSDAKKLMEYLKNQAEEITYSKNNSFIADDSIIEKDDSDYKTPENYRNGKFKIYLRKDIEGKPHIDGPNGRLPEGHPDHPWEAEAIQAEKQ